MKPHLVSLPLRDGFEFWHEESAAWHPATEPGCIHTDLLRAGLIPDPFYGTNELDLQWIERRDWTYRCRFEVPESFRGEAQQWLEFGGLDTLATVTLNGTRLGESANMFHPVAYDVKEALVTGTNELEVTFANTLDWIDAREDWQPLKERNDPVGGRSRIRKAQYHYSWDWGPRFVTCGLWRPVNLVGWSGPRLRDFAVRQNHQAGTVELQIQPELSDAGGSDSAATVAVTVMLGEQTVAEANGAAGTKFCLRIENPELWWPAGQGEQPLYTVTVSLGGQQLSKRVGLRTLELVRDLDAEGETFFFRVNGRAIFAKGANWIPDHMFVTECDRPRFAERLQSAVDAHMNMIRVWGGGVYEDEAFYDVCDELGLLVWQDFMFACALYPGNGDFCTLLRDEADHQVKRLAHRSCLAVWCGNNEIPFMPIYGDEMKKNPAWAANYAKVFHELLPQSVARHDGVTPYWPSSPWSSDGLIAEPNDGRAGDVHFWEVWHARAPVKTYETLHLRFCSEFGMQSYASAETAQTFCSPEEMNVFSRTMENHQKNGGGNATMLHYMNKRYRYAEGYANLAYLSQLSQAHCMKVGVEHFRHEQPYCMGALYWQLNDVWPVASWSSIEFDGRWKALQHESRRFFAPVLLYARAAGAVEIGYYNAIDEAIRGYDLHVVSDAPAEVSAQLVWSVRQLDGTQVEEEQTITVGATPLSSQHVTFAALPETGNRSELYLRAELRDAKDESILSRQNPFFTEPRFVDLRDPQIEWEITATDVANVYALAFTATSFAPAVCVSFGPEFNPWFSDNWFDLHAGEPHSIAVRAPGTDLATLRHHLTYTTLWHSYQPR